MTDLAAARKQAWKTRRKKYGPDGHSGSYRCGGRCAGCHSKTDMIVRLHNEGTLSEGQAAKALKVGRVELRTLAQSHPSYE